MAQLLAVVGASGGCGASTLAALLARSRARHGRTVLVDLDAGGAGVEVLLGVEAVPGVRWADLEHARGGLRPDDLRGVLPTWEGVEVLSEDRRAGTTPPDVRASVLDALTAGAETVVLDTSARTVAHVPDVARAVAAARAVLVTRQDVGGTAAALRVRALVGDAAGVVLRRCRASTVAPAEVGHALGTRVLARPPDDAAVRDSVERGLGPRPGRALRRAVARVDAALAGTAGQRPGAGRVLT